MENGRQQAKQVQVVESTPMHDHRVALAKKAKEVVPVIESWFQYVLTPYASRKGRKVVKLSKTKNGTTSEFVGWEKLIPVEFFKEQEVKSPDYKKL